MLGEVLECVANVSEGSDPSRVAELSAAAGPCLLDVHADPDHHRSVFTLAGPPPLVEQGVRSLAATAVARIDLRLHHGVHPRIGALDVVPFVALASRSAPPGAPGAETLVLVDGDRRIALEARDRFARWASEMLGLPCFLYGADRTLPDVRRGAWKAFGSDTGPPRPHPRAGACAVGARGLLIAYNLWLDGRRLGGRDLEIARAIAAELRSPALRALGLAVGHGAQVSCNLIAPDQVGPAAVFDAVAQRCPVDRSELVGLLPRAVLLATPRARWSELDIGPHTTIEARLERAGLDGGRFPSSR